MLALDTGFFSVGEGNDICLKPVELQFHFKLKHSSVTLTFHKSNISTYFAYIIVGNHCPEMLFLVQKLIFAMCVSHSEFQLLNQE